MKNVYLLLLITASSFFVSNKLFAQINMPASGSTTVGSTAVGFYDSGGSAASYGASENRQYTVCPSAPAASFKVEVSFSGFDTESFDGLVIYHGTGTAGAKFNSGRPQGSSAVNTPEGSFYGTGTANFTGGVTHRSQATDGCLTFVFKSDASVQQGGWAGTVKQVFVTSSFGLDGSTSPYHASGASASFTDPGGSGNYLDNTDKTQWVCPKSTATKAALALNFTSFSTENNFDGLMIYDGDNTSAPLISSGLPAGSNPTTCPAGSFRGTALPFGGATYTTAQANSGCLFFRFTSDGSNVSSGFAGTVFNT